MVIKSAYLSTFSVWATAILGAGGGTLGLMIIAYLFNNHLTKKKKMAKRQNV